MLTEHSCEICNENDWRVLGRRTYDKSLMTDCTAYANKRYQVLFHKWFPKLKSVTLSCVMCGNCGFIIYTPRPEPSDIDAKYRCLEQLNKEQTSLDYDSDSPLKKSRILNRSRSIFRYLDKSIDLAAVNRILDYGGGDGKLMRVFTDTGKQCCLVDYNKDCIEGVTKLADTVDDLDQAEKFDLVICCHVMEHVAQPLRVIKQLASHINEGGWMYVEVPLDVWKYVPLRNEPVTHINFFTPNSLINLLSVSGLLVQKCELASYMYQSGRALVGVRALVKKPDSPDILPEVRLCKPDGMEYLKPGLLKILRYNLYIPRHIPKAILSKVKKYIKKSDY